MRKWIREAKDLLWLIFVAWLFLTLIMLHVCVIANCGPSITQVLLDVLRILSGRLPL